MLYLVQCNIHRCWLNLMVSKIRMQVHWQNILTELCCFICCRDLGCAVSYKGKFSPQKKLTSSKINEDKNWKQ